MIFSKSSAGSSFLHCAKIPPTAAMAALGVPTCSSARAFCAIRSRILLDMMMVYDDFPL